MTYTLSQAFAGRGSKLQYSTNPPSIPYVIFAEIKTANITGSKADLADVTNMESGNIKEWLPTLIDWGEVNVAGNLIPNDAAQQAVIGFFTNQTRVNWQIVLPPNVAQGYATTLGTYGFAGFATSYDIAVPVEKEGSFSAKIKITGALVFQPGS